MRLGLGMGLGGRVVGGGGAPFDGPLDSVEAGCLFAAAFGVRLFGSSNPDFVIRRASDSAEQTFKATTGILGSDALAFLASTNGFYKTVTDQIGGLSLTTATTTLQPQAATAGVLTAYGTSIGAAVTADNLTATASLAAIPQPFTVFQVFNNAATTNGQGAFSIGTTNVFIFQTANFSTRYNGGSAVLTGRGATTGAKIVRFVIDGANSHISVDNDAPTVYDVGSTANMNSGTPRLGVGSTAITGSMAFAGIWSGRKEDGAIEAALDAIW